MRGWFSKVRTLLRGSRGQALPLHEQPDRQARPATPRVSADPAEHRAEGKGYEALKAALQESGALVIDNETLRDFTVTQLAEYRASGSLSDTLTAIFMQVYYNQELGDLKTATAYAKELVHLTEQGGDDGSETDPSRHAIYELVRDLAVDQHEAGNNEDAQALAAAAIGLVPDDPSGQYVLGLALEGLGRFDEALVSWDRAVALDPTRPFLHARRADVLGRLGRAEEAVQAIDRAHALEPGHLGYLGLRGRLRQQLGRHEAAVADFDRVIAGSQQRPGAQATEMESQSAEEEEWLTALADVVALERLRSLKELGRVDDVISDTGRLISKGNLQTALAARMLLGELYESLDRQTDALDVYAEILAVGYQDAPARVRRARLLLEQGTPDQALIDLAPLVVDQGEASNAVPVLLKLLQQIPEHGRARKALGQAYLSTWQPAKAFQALTAALAALPEDWEPRYWRGLAGVTSSGAVDPDEPDPFAAAWSRLPRIQRATDALEAAWDRSFSPERVTDAIEDLIEAATHTADPRPRAALRWLVERASAAGVLLGWLFDGTGAPGRRLLEVLPELAPLQGLNRAADLSEDRQWLEAVDELVIARAQLADARLPILAGHADARLADNYLRLYEIQRALDHLDAAEDALPLLGISLDEAVRPRAEELLERGRLQGVPNTVIDLDHLQLFSLGWVAFQNDIRTLRTQVLARTGDSARAVEVIDQAGGAQELLEDLDDGSISFPAALGMGTVLRDAHRFGAALTLGNELMERADSDQRRLTMHNFMATVLNSTGDLDGAAEHSRAALDIARREGTAEEVAVVVNNLAMNHLLRDEPQQALKLVDANQPKPDAQQPIRSGHHTIRGEALLKLGDYAGAQHEFAAALTIQDEIRGRLRTYQNRMTWHARQLSVYERAVYAATRNHDRSAALEFVERSKARAFIDQLAAGHMPPATEPHGLLEALDRVQARQRLLRRLSAAGRTGYVDYELMRQLGTLGVNADLVEASEDGMTRLAAEPLDAEQAKADAGVERLEAEIENARLAAVESIVGPILSPDELRRLLGGSDAPAQPSAGHRAETQDDPHLQARAVSLAAAVLGQHDPGEAATFADEAVAAYRGLVQTDPDTYLPELGAALKDLGAYLAMSGDSRKSVEAASEAVGIYRRLADADPETYLPDLAAALAILTSALAAQDRPEEAVLRGQEAADIYRRLAETDPGTYMPFLSRVSFDLVERLVSLNRSDEALEPARQTADRYRQLTATDPDSWRAGLVISTIALGMALGYQRRLEEALAALKDAAEIYRHLAEADLGDLAPELNDRLPVLAATLIDVSQMFAEIDKAREALTAAEESVAIFRQMAAADPQSNLLGLGITLWVVGRIHESFHLDPQAGLAATREALEILGPRENELTDGLPSLADVRATEELLTAELHSGEAEQGDHDPREHHQP